MACRRWIIAPTHATSVPAAATGTATLLGKIMLGVVLVTAVGTGVHVARLHTRAANPVAAPRTLEIHATEIPAPVVAPTTEPPAPVAPAPVLGKAPGHQFRPAVSPSAVSRPIEPRQPAAAPAAASDRHDSAELLPAEPNGGKEWKPSPVNQLLEEGRRLARARSALRAHDPELALRLLQSGPAGAAGLAQEREALTIEALSMRPESRAEASRRARAFMVAYPDSPYRARIKALVFEDR